jgi:hypothetical protein
VLMLWLSVCAEIVPAHARRPHRPERRRVPRGRPAGIAAVGRDVVLGIVFLTSDATEGVRGGGKRRYVRFAVAVPRGPAQ